MSHMVLLGSLRFDTETSTLYCGDNVVPAARKTLELLALLSERPGELVTRETLQERLWPNALVEERNLAQQIYLLRKVLAASDPDLRVENVPRRGYRLIVPAPPIAPQLSARALVGPSPALRWPIAVAFAIAVGFVGSVAANSRTHVALSDSVQRNLALGRSHWEVRDDKSLVAARSYFESVRKEAPAESKGYAGLAMVDAIVADHAQNPATVERSSRLGEKEAREALARDPADADALAVLGLLYSERDKNDVAERYFNEALGTNPAHVYAHAWRGIMLLNERRVEEGRTELARAVALEPTSKVALEWLSEADFYGRAFDLAQAEALAILSLDPSTESARWMQISIAEARARYGEALHGVASLPRTADRKSLSERALLVARFQALLGHQVAAERAFRRVDQRHVDPVGLASTQFAMGHASQARATIASLARLSPKMAHDRQFELEVDPRFAALRQLSYAEHNDAG